MNAVSTPTPRGERGNIRALTRADMLRQRLNIITPRPSEPSVGERVRLLATSRNYALVRRELTAVLLHDYTVTTLLRDLIDGYEQLEQEVQAATATPSLTVKLK